MKKPAVRSAESGKHAVLIFTTSLGDVKIVNL